MRRRSAFGGTSENICSFCALLGRATSDCPKNAIHATGQVMWNGDHEPPAVNADEPTLDR